MTPRGSTFATVLILMAVFGAVVMFCLLAAPEPQSILDQVDNSVSQFIGGAL